MTDLRELVGDEGTPEELESLQRVHELLLAAGPPPELSAALERPPATRARVSWLPRRRRQATFALAAGLAAAAFAIGFFLGDRGAGQFEERASVPMHGVGQAKAAHASILVGNRDEVGNWPLRLEVRGLEPLPEGSWYELYLTRKGKLAAYCGAFVVRKSGATTVEMTVPYRLKGFDGWVVTAHRPGGGRSKQILMTT